MGMLMNVMAAMDATQHPATWVKACLAPSWLRQARTNKHIGGYQRRGGSPAPLNHASMSRAEIAPGGGRAG